jgi:hypothetical protein
MAEGTVGVGIGSTVGSQLIQQHIDAIVEVEDAEWAVARQPARRSIGTVVAPADLVRERATGDRRRK